MMLLIFHALLPWKSEQSLHFSEQVIITVFDIGFGIWNSVWISKMIEKSLRIFNELWFNKNNFENDKVWTKVLIYYSLSRRNWKANSYLLLLYCFLCAAWIVSTLAKLCWLSMVFLIFWCWPMYPFIISSGSLFYSLLFLTCINIFI